MTYLDPIFRKYASDVYKKMINICHKIDKQLEWNLLNENDINYRPKCIEYIEYNKGDNLGWHCDMGSMITIVIMLSDKSQYKGGTFQCKHVNRIPKPYVLNANNYNNIDSNDEDNSSDSSSDSESNDNTSNNIIKNSNKYKQFKWDSNDFTYNEGKTIDVPLNKGDCIVFNSDKCNHRVTNLIQGYRNVLVMELVFY